MRYTSAYYLLLIYLTVFIKPFIPIVNDALSHEFNELRHISTVHAKYGSHHLQKEMADSNSDNDKGKNQNSLRAEDQVPFHVVATEYASPLMLNKFIVPYHLFKLHKLPFVCVSSPGQPPKFS